MKKAVLTKLIGGTLAIALCVPMLLASPVTADASVSSNVPGSDPSVSSNVPNTPGTDTPGTDTPGSAPSVSDNSSSSSSQESSAAASTTIAVGRNQTVIVAGRKVPSTMGGVYTATSINGIAVSTPAANISTAVGLSQADVNAGTNVRFYICNTNNKAAKDALTNVAASSGKKVAAYVNFDLYTITKKGVVTCVRNTSEPITLTIGLPRSAANSNTAVSLLCIDKDGKAVVMEDTDTDPATITVNTTVFGVFAIVN